MKEQGLVSTYTIAQFKPHKTACNDAATTNVLNREFEQTKARRFVVSDLTYVKVQNKWHYICVLIDLFDREIVGHSAGPNKDAALVSRAFASVKGDLRQIEWFHTDRGSEFKKKRWTSFYSPLKSDAPSARRLVPMTMPWPKRHTKS
ncbi:transposase InsO family protein [Paenibacillus sp. PastF-1]|nr:transposase InsO family protein [Paenibacillus sp. PastF-2]MDF9850211.1 transposase InsO family protein [Paenibacillus sp. PastM-2]MDF9856848.1 transposase InsO family protein [Paenibacillus sp. PastF-1]MDH6482058.1 transposase InsO family protein [Paenibacillus sp. PastH-2]MDH6509482.1 transposase InsO family protein [Paenibacillus sp. PastM-3]